MNENQKRPFKGCLVKIIQRDGYFPHVMTFDYRSVKINFGDVFLCLAGGMRYRYRGNIIILHPDFGRCTVSREYIEVIERPFHSLQPVDE